MVIISNEREGSKKVYNLSMKKKYRLGFVLIGIAFVLDVLTVLFFKGRITAPHALLVLGLYIAGNYFLAKAKGYPAIYSGMGLFRILGSFIIIILPDKNEPR